MALLTHLPTLLLLILATTGSADDKTLTNRVKVADGHFVDAENGRTLMFRGINSVVKGFPWYDPKMLDPKRWDQLEEWGFNAVRLGMMWSGFEPEEGQINETYADTIAQIVDGLGSKGIYAYLDMHQDVLKEPAEYWGIPAWLAGKLAPPAHPYPWPMADVTGFTTWACGYFSQEISNAFHQLYTNVEYSADSFATFWQEVATRFKDRGSILGYELMNEPWTGDVYEDASLILPGNAGHHLLEPFFNRASDAIRAVDNNTIIFWEPVTYAYLVQIQSNLILDGVLDAYLKTHNFSLFYPVLSLVCGDMAEDATDTDKRPLTSPLHTLMETASEAMLHRFNEIGDTADRPSILGPGFSAPPGGMAYLDRTALSWHYYCWPLASAGNEPYDPVIRGICDDVMGPMVFNTVQSRAKELGGSATFLTEFGTCYPNSALPNSTGTIECTFVLDEADRHLQSWSYWDTASGGVFWDSDGQPLEDVVRVFTRPYPPATAGKPVSLQFDSRSRVFNYTYQPDPAISLPTELFVPPLVYREGYSVAVSEGLQWKVDETRNNRILVTAPGDHVGEAWVAVNPT